MGKKEHLDEYIENQLSPTLHYGMNPGYRHENKMDNTEFRSTFQGKKDEDTDKVYFRKQDEVSRYAEANFKHKILAGKKWNPSHTSSNMTIGFVVNLHSYNFQKFLSIW